MKPTDLLSTQEVATILKMSDRSVRRLADAGHFPGSKRIGLRLIVIPRSAVSRFKPIKRGPPFRK